MAGSDKGPITGRCYCGRTTLRAEHPPRTVAYCHCEDCRRVTGAPVAAFAAFDEDTVTWAPDEGRRVTVNPGVTRTFCERCGSPLTGRYAYLPDTVFIALGILDQANDLAPSIHAHAASCLDWLRIDDDLDRITASARDELNDTGAE